MSPVWRILRRIFLWNYGRSTWQYDVLCALILAFIFLTPKIWFTSELNRGSLHQNGSNAAEKLIFWPENRNTNPDIEEIERRARIIKGRASLRVKAVHEKRDSSGEIVAYEVDIE